MRRLWIPIALLLGLAAAARAADFVIAPGGTSRVVFTSKAPIESFDGKTSQMTGTVALDPDDVRDSVTVRVEVDLASLDTGIPKRNQHMREDHLETSRYPRAVFTGVALRQPAAARLVPGRPVSFDIEGSFALHGVTRRLRTPVEVTLLPGGGKRQLRFQTSFPVSLADYSISRPQFLFMKLSDQQIVKVSGVAVER